MRRLQILNIKPSGDTSVPAEIEVGLDFTAIFHGVEWINPQKVRFPFYAFDTDPTSTTPYPAEGTVHLVATTFDIVENTKYSGKYTVFTQRTATSPASSEYNAQTGRTIIRVNETIPLGTGDELTSGFITNVSTYLVAVTGEPNLVVLENEIKDDRPIEIVGKLSVGWGEVIIQNLMRQAQSFAGPTPPAKPFQGQLWFDTINNLLKIKPTPMDNNDWQVINSAFFGGAPYRHEQTTPANTWTINHGLGLPAPFCASCDFFVNTVNGVKPILPIDVTFVNANSMTVTFSNAESGYVIVRS